MYILPECIGRWSRFTNEINLFESTYDMKICLVLFIYATVYITTVYQHGKCFIFVEFESTFFEITRRLWGVHSGYLGIQYKLWYFRRTDARIVVFSVLSMCLRGTARETIYGRFWLVQRPRTTHACFLQSRNMNEKKHRPFFKLGLPTVARVIRSRDNVKQLRML